MDPLPDASTWASISRYIKTEIDLAKFTAPRAVEPTPPAKPTPSPLATDTAASNFSPAQMQEITSLFTKMTNTLINSMKPKIIDPNTASTPSSSMPPMPRVDENASLHSDSDDDFQVHTAPPKQQPPPISVDSRRTPSPIDKPKPLFDVSHSNWRTRVGLGPSTDVKPKPEPHAPPASRPGFFAPSAPAQTRQRFADAHALRQDTPTHDPSDDSSWSGGNNFAHHQPSRDRHNAPWDSFDRNGHSFPPSREGVIAQRGTPRPSHGPTWFQFQVDPYQHVDVDTYSGTIAPWYSARAEFGLILNHPVPLNLPHIDQEFFLAQFLSVPFNAKNIKGFYDNFPKFPAKAGRSHLLVYHSELVKYSAMHGLFIPPPQTYLPNNLLGSWFDALDTFTQHHTAVTFSGILCQALLSPKNNLINNEDFGLSLMYEKNGYQILYSLALLGRHPMLASYPHTPSHPSQMDYQSIPAYISSWNNPLHILSLSGIHLSDRYFLMSLCRGIHDSFKELHRHIQNELLPYNSSLTIGNPLPVSLMPDRLLTTLQQYALFIRHPKLFTHDARTIHTTKSGHLQTPGATSNGYILREIRSSIPDLFSEESEAPSSPAEESAFHIFALQARPTGCYICDRDDHRLYDCAKLKKILDNPGGRRALRKALDDAPKDPRRGSRRGSRPILARNPVQILVLPFTRLPSLQQGRVHLLLLTPTPTLTQIFDRAIRCFSFCFRCRPSCPPE